MNIAKRTAKQLNLNHNLYIHMITYTEAWFKRKEKYEVRTREVMKLKKEGLTVKQIAVKMSVNTRIVHDILGMNKKTFKFKLELEVRAFDEETASKLLDGRLTRNYIKITNLKHL